MPEIRAADHSNSSVRPGLLGDPVQRVVAVWAFLPENVELAFGSIAAAHILQHHRVAVVQERRIAERQVGSLSVRRSHQERGIAADTGGMENIGIEMDAVAHRNARVQ